MCKASYESCSQQYASNGSSSNYVCNQTILFGGGVDEGCLVLYTLFQGDI